MLQALRRRARALKAETYALYLACRDQRTPLAARLVGALVIAYALSPVDLVPDFIPVLGYLDDLVLLPLGIALTVRLIPTHVLKEARAQAAAAPLRLSSDWRAGAVVVGLWLLTAAVTAAFVIRLSGGT